MSHDIDVETEWQVKIYKYINMGTYTIIKPLKSSILSDYHDDTRIETNFIGRYTCEYLGSPKGTLAKCIYNRDNENIRIYIVFIHNMNKYILAYTDTFDSLLKIESNHIIKNYFGFHTIDNFFKNLTTESFDNLMQNHNIEFKYGTKVDYIQIPLDKRIIGDIHFDLIKDGLSDECNGYVDSLGLEIQKMEPKIKPKKSVCNVM